VPAAAAGGPVRAGAPAAERRRRRQSSVARGPLSRAAGPGEEAGRELRHRGTEPERNERVHHGCDQEEIRNREPGLAEHDHTGRGERHRERAEDVAARDDARAMGDEAPLLDERLQRDDEEPARDADQHEVGQQPPASTECEEGARADRDRGRGPRPQEPVQVEGEEREPDRAERHDPGLEPPGREAVAERAAEPHADREHRQQHRHQALVAAEDLVPQAGELHQQDRAVGPEPRDGDDGEEDAPVPPGEADRAERLGQRVPVDAKRRIGRRRRGHAEPREETDQRQRHDERRHG
jgi:hypothetical protein